MAFTVAPLTPALASTPRTASTTASHQFWGRCSAHCGCAISMSSWTREFSVQQIRIVNLEKEVSSRDTQLERIAESLAQTRAGLEELKNLRLAAEQKSADLAAARKSLESQLAQEAQQREQLLSERRDEHEQMRACVGKVNDLRSRVRAKLAAKEKP